jgi:hypothetical protein
MRLLWPAGPIRWSVLSPHQCRSPASASPWASLLTDLLLDLSGRLHDVRDFLRFHAVCRAWRDAAAAPSQLSPAAGHRLLPWLISRPNVNRSLMHSPCSTSTASSRLPRMFGGTATGTKAMLCRCGHSRTQPSWPVRTTKPFGASA